MIGVTKITKHGCLTFDCITIDYKECWIYNGPAYWSDGYPIISRLGKNWIASRFIWYILTGRDYPTKDIHHECVNRACVNPFHLLELTRNKHSRWHSKRRSRSIVKR